MTVDNAVVQAFLPVGPMKYFADVGDSTTDFPFIISQLPFAIFKARNLPEWQMRNIKCHMENLWYFSPGIDPG
jgi:hypothetical protein